VVIADKGSGFVFLDYYNYKVDGTQPSISERPLGHADFLAGKFTPSIKG